jgi:hypothetical protein
MTLAGILVAYFILGGAAPIVAARQVAMSVASAIVKNDFAFILFSLFHMLIFSNDP